MRPAAAAAVDAGAPTTAGGDASAAPAEGDLEREERACDEATGKLDAKLEAARACTRDADCVVVNAACIAPCGRALNAARAATLKPEIDALQSRCLQRCGKAKCAAWVANKPVCRAGTCEIPRR